MKKNWTKSGLTGPIQKSAYRKVRQSKHAPIKKCNNPKVRPSKHYSPIQNYANPKCAMIQNVYWFKHELIQMCADPNVRRSTRAPIQMCNNPSVHQSNNATIKCGPDIWKKTAFTSTAKVYGKPLNLNSKEAPGHADHEMEVRTKALTFLWLSLSIWRLYKFHHITT